MDSGLSEQLRTATNLMQQGDLDGADATISRLKTDYDSSGVVWALASEISLRMGKINDAWLSVDRAVKLEETNSKRHVQRARCAVLAGMISEARASVNSAIQLGVSEGDDLLMLASVLVRCDDHDGALDLYKQAEPLQPDRNELHHGMATVYRYLGDIEKAEQACDKAIEANPHDYEMLNLRSSLRKQNKYSNHLEELTGLLEQGVKDWRGAVQVAYAAAKEFEDLGDFDQAFRYLEQGASLRRRNTRYDVKDDIQIFTAIREAFSKEDIDAARGSGFVSDAPIFVLGLPRTGSTLVERIISSHSKVTMAGELNDFAIELMKLVIEKNRGRQPARLELPGAALRVDMYVLGENYINSVKPLISNAPRFIDKLPLNSLYLALIYLALPNAKVVHVNRHPVDACLAMYKYLFKNAYPFSYDLDELADYYIAHHKLMMHWRDILPDNWFFDIHYEDIINSQSKTTKELLEYLGLEWEDACLEFHRNEQASTTGSATQVRKPVYSTSVGKWRSYAVQLKPVLEKFQDAGISID